MVIVRKVPAHVQRTSDWLSAELELADQLAALGFFSSDEDAFSTASSSSASEAPRLPKKRYGGTSSRRQPSVSAGLIRDYGRKRVGWRRRRRLDNELEIVHGTSNVDFDADAHLEPIEMNVELLSNPPSAPLACLFRDSDALKKWLDFAKLPEEEQEKQLQTLLQTEEMFGTKYGAGESSVDLSEPVNFSKALNAAKKQLRKVGRPLCKQLRRLSSPSLMSNIENELLAHMGDAAAQQLKEKVPKKVAAAVCSQAVTCCWKTSCFKAFTEKITLEALCKFYDYHLTISNSLETVNESSEAGEDGGQAMEGVNSVSNDTDHVLTIFSKNWKWPPVRLANIFFMNQSI